MAISKTADRAPMPILIALRTAWSTRLHRVAVKAPPGALHKNRLGGNAALFLIF
jgi:hypothetical protein